MLNIPASPPDSSQMSATVFTPELPLMQSSVA
jgi:hypothetical protein